MKKYKLLTKYMTSRNGFKWEMGKKYTIDKPGDELCSDQVFHFYDSPTHAVLFNPIHADITNPLCYEVECDEVSHDGLKGGAKWMKLAKQVPLPEITTEQIVSFGIYCSLEVYKEPSYVEWANNWLSSKDRSKAAARATLTAALTAAHAAAYAAAGAAALAAARAALTAAHAAAHAAAGDDALAAARAALTAADPAAAVYAADADDAKKLIAEAIKKAGIGG